MENINTGKLDFDNRANSIMENKVLTEFECYPLVREYNSAILNKEECSSEYVMNAILVEDGYNLEFDL